MAQVIVSIGMAWMEAKISDRRRAKKYQNVYLRLQALANSYQEYKHERRLLDYVEACGHNVGL